MALNVFILTTNDRLRARAKFIISSNFNFTCAVIQKKLPIRRKIRF